MNAEIEKLFITYEISISDYPMEKYSHRTDEDLRSSIRAMNRRLDELHIEAAQICNILPLKPGKKFWVLSEIDWDYDPKLTPIFEKCKEMESKIFHLQNVVKMRNAIKEDNVKWILAQDKAYEWGKDYSDEELIQFFKQHGLAMGFSSLTSELVKNPNYLKEKAMI